MAGMTAVVKTRIVKLFKQGTAMNEIKAQVKPHFPKITATAIQQVVRKHLMGECDKLWSKVIRQVGHCEVCGNPDYSKLEAHHLIDRGNYKYRWDVSCGVCLDFTHHKYGNDICAHGSNDVTSKFLDWLKVNRPGQFAWLMEHRDDKQSVHYGCEELLKVCDDLTAMLNTKLKKPDLGVRQPATNIGKAPRSSGEQQKITADCMRSKYNVGRLIAPERKCNIF